MSTTINKRQQARHERALQDLISNVPGNDRCADCGSSNPGWTSWSLGIFLCMRCASLHRKLGTHISKVKSLSMDSWSAEQVEAMRSVGNTASNKIYNPRNVRPTLPLDPDEIDTAMEKYIRQKYQRKTLSEAGVAPIPRTNTGSTSSTLDIPPPPPPKPNSARFASNIRTTSAAYPSPFSSGRSSPSSAGQNPSAVENKSLPPLPGQLASPQGPTPQVYSQSQMSAYAQHPGPSMSPLSQQPSGYQTIGGAQYRGQIETTSNPFHRQMRQPPPQQQPLEASFQSMHIQPSTLTPEITGSWQQPGSTTNPFLPSYTPPISPAPQFVANGGVNPGYGPQPGFVPQYTGTPTNPFLQRAQTMPASMTQQQVPQMILPNINSNPPLASPNPFYAQSQTASPAVQSVQQQQYFPVQQAGWSDSGHIAQAPEQTYQGQNTYTPALEQQSSQQQQQPYHVQQSRFDKSSILALYGQPHLAPPRSAASGTASPVFEEPPNGHSPRRSVTMPVQGSKAPNPGNKNPFASLAGPEDVPVVTSPASKTNGMGVRDHSPDAFRNLSSMYR